MTEFTARVRPGLSRKRPHSCHNDLSRLKQGVRLVAESTKPLRVVEETPAYWRIFFDYPPFNVADGTMFQALQDLFGRMTFDQSLRVFWFESANLDFYLSPFALTAKLATS